MKSFSKSIQHRAKCTGRLAPRFTPFTARSHSKMGHCTSTRPPAKPVVKSSFTRQAETAAMIRETRKCTKKFESAKYQDVIFRPDRVEGKIASQGPFTVRVHGILMLHGSEHELTVPAQAEFAGDHWTGSANFKIPFIDWGLKNPSNFFLKVEHAVQVELELKGHLQNSTAP
jgi:hypothetical protein